MPEPWWCGGERARNAGLEADEHLLNLAEAKRQWVMREGELDARVEELEVERDELLDRTEELSAMVDDEKSLLEQFEANFKKEYKVRSPWAIRTGAWVSNEPTPIPHPNTSRVTMQLTLPPSRSFV